MNDPFLPKLIETVQSLLLDPVTQLHLLVAGVLCVALGFVVMRKTADSFGAANLGLPMMLSSYVLGGGGVLAGFVAAEMFVLPQMPKSLPLAGYLGGVLAVLVLALAAPITKVLLKLSYSSAASVWLTVLGVCAVIVFGADFGFTNFGPQMARVIDHKGPVSYRLTATATPEDMKKRRMGLPLGAEIITRADSSATLDLGTKGYITVRPLTIVRIRAVGDNATLELETGRVIGSVKHTAATKFQIRTPAANTGIVGTDFMVDSDTAKQTIVVVATGKVAVSAPNGTGTVEVGAGYTTSAAPGRPPSPPRLANPADIGIINSFKAAVGDPMSRRNKAIEDAM